VYPYFEKQPDIWQHKSETEADHIHTAEIQWAMGEQKLLAK
jgi:hypothetical protein